MKTPDTQLIRDLDSLYSTDARFQRVAEWLKLSLSHYRESGDLLDGNDLYRNQGKCIVLQDLMGYVENSRELLERTA